MVLKREMEAARAAAFDAGELALRLRKGNLRVEVKADTSPVTEADRECERLITARLSQAFPEDGLLGEEGYEQGSRGGRRWIIDPIDGTRDYLRGNRMWGVLIALEESGEVVAGVAHFPALGETYHAVRGGGAYCNERPVRVSSISDPAQAVFCFNGFDRLHEMSFGERLPEWMRQFWAVRNLGGSPDAMMVVCGQAEAWLEHDAKPWDLAPIKILTEEAGGCFFNFDGGKSIYGGNCVTCTPGLEDLLRELVSR